jgi:hypothetical protein
LSPSFISTQSWDKIWAINKKVIDPVAPKFNAVSTAARCVLRLSNVAATEIVQLALHQKNPAVTRPNYLISKSILHHM